MRVHSTALKGVTSPLATPNEKCTGGEPSATMAEGLDEATPFVLLSFELQLDKPSADSAANTTTVSTIRAGVQNRFAPAWAGEVLLDESIECFY